MRGRPPAKADPISLRSAVGGNNLFIRHKFHYQKQGESEVKMGTCASSAVLTASMRYAPRSSATAARVTLVSWEASVTLARGMTAPVSSRTMPARMPLLVCAIAGRWMQRPEILRRQLQQSASSSLFVLLGFWNRASGDPCMAEPAAWLESRFNSRPASHKRRSCMRRLPRCVTAETSLASVRLKCARWHPKLDRDRRM